jgi:hypothetical protein
MPFKVVSQKGFLKGLVASMNRFSSPKGSILRSSNLLLSERGALVTCDGTMTIAQQNIGESIVVMGIYVDPVSFAVTPIMGTYAGSAGLGIWSFGLTPVSGFTLLQGLALTAGWTMPQFVNFAGSTIISTGNATGMWQYNGGTAFSLLAANTAGPGGGAAWLPDHYYSVGDRITANDGNSVVSTFQVVNVTVGSASGTMANAAPIGGIGGYSGSTEPAFGGSTIIGTGNTIADNQVIWMLIKQDANMGKEAVPYGAAHIINHAAALWAWNTAPQTQSSSGTGDGPSVLRMSGANNPNSWPLANSIFIGKDDGTQGTGLATFTVAEAGISPTGSLVCFKDYSTYTVTGVFGAQNFAVNEVKTDMGCLAPRSIAFATGFGVIRFCHLGFALFDGINDRLISEEIRPYILGSPEVVGVDFARLNQGYGCLTTNPPLYVCALPTRDGLNSRIFAYDLVMRAWMICDYTNSNPNYPIRCMEQIRPPYVSGFPATTLIADDGPAGQTIRRWQGGDTQWDATSPPTPVSWMFRPPEVGDPGSRAYFRRANVRLRAPQPGQLTGFFEIGEASQPNNTQNQDGAGPSSGMPPNVSTVTNYDGDQDLGVALDIAQTGPSLSGTYNSSGPVIIEGVDYHITAKNPRPFGQKW